MNYFDLLHFLRPAFLFVLPFVALTWWLVRQHEARRSAVAGFVAPHLQNALIVNRNSRSTFRPIDGAGIMLLAATIAAAGPTWSKQQSPWFSETAPLVIAMEVSDSMRSSDLQPTRLDRARFKVVDLIEQRTGSRTGLIAYAGSAHIVMPPSKDADVIKLFLESLDPAIMPEAGANAISALPLAQGMLGDEAAIGTVLFVADGFVATDVPALREYSSRADAASIVTLVVGTDTGGVAMMPDGSVVLNSQGGRMDTSIDVGVLNRLESEAGIPVIRASTSDSDVRRLIRRIESNLQLADDPNAQWRDQAWWFVWPAVFLTLLWFRRGWTMRW